MTQTKPMKAAIHPRGVLGSVSAGLGGSMPWARSSASLRLRSSRSSLASISASARVILVISFLRRSGFFAIEILAFIEGFCQ